MKTTHKLKSLSRIHYNLFKNQKLNDSNEYKVCINNFILYLVQNYIYIKKKQVNFQTYSYQLYNSNFIEKARKFNNKECKHWLKYKKINLKKFVP